jgi:phosphoglycerate dehydrogenase-like enzyme
MLRGRLGVPLLQLDDWLTILDELILFSLAGRLTLGVMAKVVVTAPLPGRWRDILNGHQIVASETVLTRQQLLAARVVANFGVGYDNIDVEACSKRGVVVTNTPDVMNDSDQLFGMDLAGATLGIVGLGRIGRAVATRARAFGMSVVYTQTSQPEPGWLPLGVLLERSDVVSLHCPFARMKPDSVLVNTGRGALIDEDALVAALAAGPKMAEIAASCIRDRLAGRRPPNVLNPDAFERHQ